MKKKFIWLVVSCLMVAALILASCAPAVVEEKEAKVVTKEPEKKAEKVEEVVKKEGPQYGGILTTAVARSPISLDPLDRTSESAYWSHVWDSLVYPDWWADRAINPMTNDQDPANAEELWIGRLAESWEQPDNYTLIYHLRKGVRWQNKPPLNGREFVAEDVVRFVERQLAGPKWVDHLLQRIDTITAPDKYTVVYKMGEPHINMPGMVGLMDIGPIDVVDQHGDLRSWENLVGTGPFSITDYMPDVSMTFERNPDYWLKDNEGRSLPYLDGVKILLIADRATQVAALRTGKVDTLSPQAPVFWDSKDSLEASNPELEWNTTPSPVIYVIIPRNTQEPFNNLKVRQAMSMVANRQEIADSVFGGHATAMAWPARSGFPNYVPLEELPEDIREIYDWKPENVEKAKALLAEAGYPNGFEASIQYDATGKWVVYEPAVELCHAYWKDIGINLKLISLDSATKWAIKGGYPTFDVYEDIFACVLGTATPIMFMANNYRTGGDYNFGQCSDPEVDRLCNEAEVEFDPVKRYELLRELSARIQRLCFAINMPMPVDYSAWHPWVKGYAGEASLGDASMHIWLDQDLRKEMTGR